MERGIGESLRQARVARGLELADVQAATKIRLRYLQAIEEERWDALPAPAYARGFIRTYAQHVGLDPEAITAEFRRLSEPAEPERPQIEPVFDDASGPRMVIPPGRWRIAALIAGAVVVLLAVIGLLAGGGGGGGHGGGPKHAPPPRAETSKPTTTPKPQPTTASVRLIPTGTVWVCLVDAAGRKRINGVTLNPGAAEGPFQSKDFTMTFGNGQVRMDVDGKPVAVPDVASPIGFEVTPTGAHTIGVAARPTCA